MIIELLSTQITLWLMNKTMNKHSKGVVYG